MRAGATLHGNGERRAHSAPPDVRIGRSAKQRSNVLAQIDPMPDLRIAQ